MYVQLTETPKMTPKSLDPHRRDYENCMHYNIQSGITRPQICL